MQSLPDIVHHALFAHGVQPSGICVAFSGGRDSTVLLHVLYQLKLAVPLRAVHVDHGLQAESSGWAAQCETVCRRWGVPCAVLRVDVPRLSAAGGPEAAAREARYAALRRQLGPGEFLVAAHHRDDQLETVLLRLLRGAGPAGMAGIRACAGFGPGYLLRPMLEVESAAVAEYARQHGLGWSEDPSNADPAVDRNFLRLEIIPRLRTRWPAAARTAARAAQYAGEASSLLDELAAIDAMQAVVDDTLGLAALRALSPPRQRNLLRWFLRERGFQPPAGAALHDGLDQLLEARADRAPRLSWSDGELRRYRDRVYLLRCHIDQVAVPGPQRWDGRTPLELGALAGTLTFRTPDGRGGESGPELTVRFRTGGERLLQHGQHVRLKTLFQAGGIVPWMRAHVPLVYRGDELLSVGGLWYAESRADPGKPAIPPLCWAPRERLR